MLMRASTVVVIETVVDNMRIRRQVTQTQDQGQEKLSCTWGQVMYESHHEKHDDDRERYVGLVLKDGEQVF